MTTRNLVPRGDSEGKLGISSKRWEEVNAVTLKVANLQNTSGSLLLKKGPGIEDIALDSGQLKIALDDTFLTSLGFNADGTQPTFTRPSGAALDANTVIAEDDSIVSAIQKLNEDLKEVSSPTTLGIGNFAAANIVIESEGIGSNDNDTTLPTSAAVKDYVDTQITAQDLDLAGDSETTGAVDLDSQSLTIAGGTGLTSAVSGQTVTLNIDNTAVSPGNYGSATSIPTFTVDPQGRLTAADAASISTSLTIQSDDGVDNVVALASDTLKLLGGNGITSSNTADNVTFTLDNTTVIPNPYGSGTQVATFTVDAQGRLTAAANTSISITTSAVTDFTEAVEDTVDAQFDNGTHTGISVTYTDDGGESDGALSLAIISSGVTAAMLNNDIISGKSALEAGLASTDEFLISDAGTVKKMDVSVLQTFLQSNLNFTSNTDVDVSKANLLTRLASFDSSDTVNIGDNDNDTEIVIRGNLTVQGTTSTVNSTTITVDDKNIELGSVDTPTDTTADGGGITLKGATDKTILWENDNDAWEFSEHVVLANSKEFKIDNGGGTPVSVLSATTLGSEVVSSSLTSVGTLTVLQVDNININGNTISSTAGTDLNITPLTGQQIVLDDTIIIDAGVITGASSITSAEFSGPLTGNADTATQLAATKTIGMTGDVSWTSAAFDGSGNVTGTSTIQANAVESSMLNNNIVSGLDDIGAALATTDEIIVSDNGTIKRADLSRLSTMLAGDGLLDSSGTLNLNIDSLNALGGTGLHQTQDHFVFSDNGTEKKITFSNLEDAIFANMNSSSSDITVAAGGEISIDNTSIVFGKLAAAAVVTEAEGISSFDNDTTLPTSAAVKDYVDTLVTAQDLDFQGDTGGALAIDLDNETLVIAGGTGIDTVGNTNTLTVAIDSTVTTLAGTQTLTNKTLTSPKVTDLNIVDTTITFEGDNEDDHELVLTITEPTEDRTLTLPDATDTLVGRATTDTLTNKTLTSPKVTDLNIVDTTITFEGDNEDDHELVLTITEPTEDRTLTLPDATDTLVGRATTDTLTNKTLTSPVLNAGVSGTAILDEDNMASNSATQLATQQSIKAYVDTQISGGDLDFQGDSGGALSIDLDSEVLDIAGGTGIDTVGDTNTLTVSIDSTVATLTGTQTLTNKVITAPTVSSLSLSDSSIVFEGSSADDHETTLSVTNPTDDRTLTLPDATDTLVGRATSDTLTNKTLTSAVLNSTISGTSIKDEDNMISDSASHLATQQSIKAYVDAQVTVQDLDLAGDSGTGAVDLDSQSLTISGGTGLTSTAADQTVTLAIDSTVATLTGNQTLTTKTIDADNNTISNIEVDNFKASAIVTESEEIANNDNDTTLPTSAAVKDYVDEQLGRHGGMFKTDTTDNSLGANVQNNRDVIFDSSPLVRSHFGPFAFDLGQLITDPWPGGSDLIFYGSQTVQSSDRHFLVIGSGDTKGNCKFTGASYIDGGEQTP